MVAPCRCRLVSGHQEMAHGSGRKGAIAIGHERFSDMEVGGLFEGAGGRFWLCKVAICSWGAECCEPWVRGCSEKYAFGIRGRADDRGICRRYGLGLQNRNPASSVRVSEWSAEERRSLMAATARLWMER